MTGDFTIAIHALVYLNHCKTTKNSEEIAKNVCTNPVRIRKILSKLKKSNVLTTKEGEKGGYYYSVEENNVSLAFILKAIESNLVYANWHSGNKNMKCLIASGMADIMDGIYKDLDETCRNRLENTTIKDIDERIFG